MTNPFNPFHPKHFFAALKEIDRLSILPAKSIKPSQRILFSFLIIGVCLLVVHYCKYSAFLNGVLEQVAHWQHRSLNSLLFDIRRDPFGELYFQAWWGLVHVIGFFVIPALFIKLYLKEPLAQHGLQWGEVNQHLRWYFFLAAPIICFAIIVSFRHDFATHYPFYGQASRSWFDFIAWETIYIIQFIVLEFFFRGFVLNSLKPAFGSNAILVMCLPYLMIHFPKPWLEATGALLFGLFMGVLALQSRSIWGGVAVHVSIALTMDIAALLQTTGMPDTLMP